MKQQLQAIEKAFLQELDQIASFAELAALEQAYFSRKSGKLTKLMKEMQAVSKTERKELGQLSNASKDKMLAALAEKRGALEAKRWETLAHDEAIDVTQPLLPRPKRGHLHPISLIEHKIDDFFRSMGFLVLDGPELDSDYYNFTAVNIPPTHPARDSQDTFYIKNHPEWVMRTHTSTMQVRAPQKYGVPLRFVVPGRCFRNEATDARHEHTFYQLEGMVIDRGISFADLKGVLEELARFVYGSQTQVRLRPKFYPFVEPGVNGEVTCFLCAGLGCRVCKQSGWLEIFGAGPTHPNVLREAGIDPDEYQAFAFGFGLDRLVMLKYGIQDIRLFHSGDLRFLEQF